ncbi:MAG: hypothetical protein RIQ79_2533 [Verrucomicrobiota bacterium]
MNFTVGATFTVIASLATAMVWADTAVPGGMDPAKRDDRLSTEQKAVLPEVKPLQRNEVLLDKRVAPPILTRKEATVGDRRSSIEVGETRDKKMFSTPERKNYEVIDRKESQWSGKMSRYSTADDAYRSRTAIRFQDKISDASPVSRTSQAVVEKRTTFDRINRFVFQKNSDQSVSVFTAGSEKASTDASRAFSPGTATAR